MFYFHQASSLLLLLLLLLLHLLVGFHVKEETRRKVTACAKKWRSSENHHQHQQDILATSSLPPLPNFHAVSTHHECNQSLIFNNGDEYHDFIPSCNTIMVQDLGFHHWTNTGPSFMNLYSQNQETMPQIKEEFVDSLNNTFLPNSSINSHLNQIPSPSPFPFSMAMDLRSLDILASSKLARSFYHPSMNSKMFFNEDALHELAHHHHHHQEQEQETHVLSNGHHHYQMKTSAHGVSEEKRSVNNICQSAAAAAAAAKKHRLDSRSSTFSHFKVRKEKLGDRIAALQQLVSPFGKTDTASVLMEAIGYIKFLQDQVETLSVPYMRSSGNKKLRTFQGKEMNSSLIFEAEDYV
ncbi:Myc-type basic helix-loop-helix (bHLH) domain-containing protein [Dioscorea alata]|uniref:Myc-type basic helix-loop-helix (BHLH) domain-containing protein n=1 Tax=Dioscorea alata TaxID=55571 RepID=A0ACB7UEN8_DIOAL|nr:Myc-type basic helix-loop-helix (bHLH) domain-containing protein [Dioscorea alata]